MSTTPRNRPATPRPDPTHDTYDVVVIGGGTAGLSGALALVRSRRSVLVVDAGRPRNAPAAHLHNYLSRDGAAPGDLLAAGRAEVTGYGGRVVPGTVTAATRADDGRFRVTFGDGTVVQARRVLLATGLVDELPDIPGLAGRWGRDVVHCPYCHGWEVRDRAIVVLATSPLAVHTTLLWRQLSNDVTFVRHAGIALDDATREQFAARGITVVDGAVTALEIADDALTGVRLDDGSVLACQALAVQSRPTVRDDLLAGLGLSTADLETAGHTIGTHIPADPTGATDVPGVWVAGNVADPMGQLLASAAAGLKAGAVINADLAAEDTAAAVAQARARARARAGTPA